MEKYLSSRDGRHYVADEMPDSAKAVIFEAFPNSKDLEAKRPVSKDKTPLGASVADEGFDLSGDGIGVMYLSNVPLFSMSEDTEELIPEMEATRLSPHPTSEYLKSRFNERMTDLIFNDSIRLVAYKSDLVKRYYDAFLRSADALTVEMLNKRLREGSLAVIPFPQYTRRQIERATAVYSAFKSAFDKLMKL